MKMDIIRAKETDTHTIAMIGRISFRSAFGKFFHDQEELLEYLDYTYDQQKIRRSISKENNIYLIVTIDNVPVGFAKMKLHSLHENIESLAQCQLQKIYVLPYYHGSGAGGALLEAVMEIAREAGAEYVWLNTVIENHRAIRFYRRHGFEKTGREQFTIGSQQFEYHIMSVAVTEEVCHC